MPNILMIPNSSLFPIPENTRFGGKSGGGGAGINYEQEMRRQEQMMERQMALQQQYQKEAEERMRKQREEDRILEQTRRVEAAQAKVARTKELQQREAAVSQEMVAQSKQDISEFGGGFNLDMPTIERPGYEQQTRPL